MDRHLAVLRRIQLRPYLRWMALVVVLLVNLLAYGDIFELPFTGTDTYTLIDTARIQSFGDVVRIFSQPLMAGTAGANRVQYFRPVTTLSFSLDYAVWGLNPWGYYFTNFLLHLFFGFLLFWFLERISDDLGIALLATLVFLIHPVLTQSVSVISHRQDILVGLFGLLSLLLVDSGRNGAGRKVPWVAVGFTCLAMLSKEIGFLTPLFVFSYLFLFCAQDIESSTARWKFTLKASSPFLFAAVVIAVWRTIVVGGTGVGLSLSLDAVLANIKDIGNAFLTTLIDPGNLIYAQLQRIYSPYPSRTLQVISFILLVLAILILISLRSLIIRWIQSRSGWISKALILLLLGALFISLLAVLLYPLFAPLFEDIIGNALDGHGWQFLLRVMEGRDRTSLAQYLFRLRDTLIGASYRIAIYTIFALIALNTLTGPSNDRRKRTNRVLGLMILWMLFGLVMFVFMSRVSWRSLYIFIAAFSSVFSILTYSEIKILVDQIRSNANQRVIFQRAAQFCVSLLCVGVFGVIVVNLLAYSTVFRKATLLEKRAEVTQTFFTAFEGEILDIPDGAMITLLGLPSLDDSYLLDYTIKSWLDLQYPGNEMTVTIQDRVAGVDCIDCLRIEVVEESGNRYNLLVEFTSAASE
jgi:hypothetical protein